MNQRKFGIRSEAYGIVAGRGAAMAAEDNRARRRSPALHARFATGQRFCAAALEIAAAESTLT